VLHWAVGALFEPSITGADEPHGDCPPDMAPWALGFKGLAGTLPHEAQRLFGPGALHPEDSTVMELARIRDARISDAQRLSERPQIDHMMPVAMVAGPP
jgi:hypothetical protein